jgi:hypothetical protein
MQVGRHLQLEAVGQLSSAWAALPAFFGRVDIDGQSGIMTVTLKHVDDRALWSVDIEPRPDARPERIVAQHI